MIEHKTTGKIERRQYFVKKSTVPTRHLMCDHLAAVLELFQDERKAKIRLEERDGIMGYDLSRRSVGSGKSFNMGSRILVHSLQQTFFQYNYSCYLRTPGIMHSWCE